MNQYHACGRLVSAVCSPFLPDTSWNSTGTTSVQQSSVLCPPVTGNKPVRDMWMLLATSFLEHGSLCRGWSRVQGHLSSPFVLANLASDPEWQVLEKCLCWDGEAGSQCWEQLGAAIKSISSIDLVHSWNSYVFDGLLAYCPLRRVWEIVIGVLSLIPQVTGFGYCLHYRYSWRSAFDAVLLCFESRLFLSYQIILTWDNEIISPSPPLKHVAPGSSRGAASCCVCALLLTPFLQ